MRQGAIRTTIVTAAAVLMSFVTVCDEIASIWRSTLYPEDWTSAFEDVSGRFLHDFSYSGYHKGEAEPPDTPPGAVFDVVAGYGADNTGAADATAAIQAAIDAAAAAGQGIVYLPAGLYRCDGQLSVAASAIVFQGDGPGQTKLYFTKFENMEHKQHLAFRGNVVRGPDIPLVQDGQNRSHDVYVADASGLSPGDEIAIGWVTGDDFYAEHNMADTWVPSFKDQWWPFFRRTVTAVDTGSAPHKVTVDIPLRYAAKVRDSASIRVESGYIEECGFQDIGIATAVDWADAWSQEAVYAVGFDDVKHCWVRNVKSFISPADSEGEYHMQNCGILVQRSKHVTVTDCRIEKAQNRGGGGCGYLYTAQQANEVLFRDCIGRKGRHNFVVNWGFGTEGCVFLRCLTSGSEKYYPEPLNIGIAIESDYHHVLAMACLVDSCIVEDGWYGGNRQSWSSGAGLTCTENVYWNTRGGGAVKSWAYGWGYVIGTEHMDVQTELSADNLSSHDSAPEDFVEGLDAAALLRPQSLYEDQRARRLAAGEPDDPFEGSFVSQGDAFMTALASVVDPAALTLMPTVWAEMDFEGGDLWLDWATGGQAGPAPLLGDGIPDAWEAALAAEVLRNTVGPRKGGPWWTFAQDVRTDYENNIDAWTKVCAAQLAVETDPGRIALIEQFRDDLAGFMAAVLGSSQQAQAAYLALVEPLGLTGTFEVFVEPGDGSHVLFTAAGNPDADGDANIEEHAAAVAEGGGMAAFVERALYSFQAFDTPALSTGALAALALALAAAGLRRS